MRTEIGFDYAAVGLMTAAAQGGFLVFALISGLFASVIGARKAIIFSVFLCAACLILMPLAGNSLIVGVLLALMAAAAASVWIPMVAVCKELIPAKHQGKAFGLISSGTAYGVFINGLARAAVDARLRLEIHLAGSRLGDAWPCPLGHAADWFARSAGTVRDIRQTHDTWLPAAGSRSPGSACNPAHDVPQRAVLHAGTKLSFGNDA